MSLETIAYGTMIAGAGYGAYSASRQKMPEAVKVSPSPIKVDEKQSITARDEVLKRLAKLRRATLTSELSEPNIRRRKLGAGV